MSGLAQGVLEPVAPENNEWQFRGMSQRMSRLGGGGRKGGARNGPQRVAPTVHYTFRNRNDKSKVIEFILNTEKHRTSLELPESPTTMDDLRSFLNSIATPGIAGLGRNVLEGYDRWAVMSFKILDGKDDGPETMDFEVQFFHPEDDEDQVLAETDDEDEDSEEEEDSESEEGEQRELAGATSGANARRTRGRAH